MSDRLFPVLSIEYGFGWLSKTSRMGMYIGLPKRKDSGIKLSNPKVWLPPPHPPGGCSVEEERSIY